ncbi:MAG: cobalt ABC transporter permease [Deltaproteobacteria bacterium SG8_13]|nr:MAG: cobalt ABC transporter permease [Deltaproteobacteria bacterium SG8_13]
MIDEPFAHGSSIIHRIDPRFKAVFAGALSVATAVSYRFEALFFALGLSLLLVIAARLAMGLVIKKLMVVVGFLLLLWLVLPLTFEGEVFTRIGPVKITRPGLILSAQITLKSLSILMMFIALVTTASLVTLGHAMDRLGIPAKIVHLLLMSYRYIFVIEQEYRRLSRAAAVRGFTPGTNLHTYRTYAYLVGMIFVRAAERADQVYKAMRCRGFNGRFYCLAEFPAHRRNWIFAGLMTISLAVLVLLEFTNAAQVLT